MKLFVGIVLMQREEVDGLLGDSAILAADSLELLSAAVRSHPGPWFGAFMCVTSPPADDHPIPVLYVYVWSGSEIRCNLL
mmetsp:Transcript_21942/g.66685  ORF Transcript_21942/g.66685 Transcript_21942/m.66685 type:complete len:80 (+) Transcript_21942:1650-1889(+)|eukprot:scaffold81482_cov39-Tisochrysis_lutea.AAC.2